MKRVILSGRRINFEDDLVVVKKDGKTIYKGMEDYEPMKYEDWKWDNKKGLYTLTGGYTKECIG